MMDERIYQGQQKIWSEMGRLMYYLAVFSLLIKGLALHMGLGQCVTEYLIVIGVPVYHLIRSWQLKISFLPAKGKARKRVWLIRFLEVVLIGGYCIFSNDLDMETGIVFIIVFVTIFSVTRMLTVYLEEKRARRLEREFDEED